MDSVYVQRTFSTAPPAAEEGLTVHVTARAASSLLSVGHQTRRKAQLVCFNAAATPVLRCETTV